MFAIPLKDKTSKTVIATLQALHAQAQVKIKMLCIDQEHTSAEFQAWAAKERIALRPSPANTHQANGQAENTVGQIKEKSRVIKQTGGACGFHLLPWATSHAPKMLNRMSVESDPQQRGRSPAEIWPTAPYQYYNLPAHPLFCRIFLLEGKRTDRLDYLRRA